MEICGDLRRTGCGGPSGAGEGSEEDSVEDGVVSLEAGDFYAGVAFECHDSRRFEIRDFERLQEIAVFIEEFDFRRGLSGPSRENRRQWRDFANRGSRGRW